MHSGMSVWPSSWKVSWNVDGRAPHVAEVHELDVLGAELPDQLGQVGLAVGDLRHQREVALAEGDAAVLGEGHDASTRR